MMIFRLPFSQGASSSASGTRVVLPAAGARTSTADCCAAACARVHRAPRRSAEVIEDTWQMALIRHHPRRRVIQ
jgi:hypothetical protein